MKYAQRTTLLVLLVLLSACAQLGLVVPQTFEQKLAYANATHTALVKSADNAAKTKQITLAEAKQVYSIASAAEPALDLARAAQKTGDINAAEARLALATGVLDQLTKFLAERGVK